MEDKKILNVYDGNNNLVDSIKDIRAFTNPRIGKLRAIKIGQFPYFCLSDAVKDLNMKMDRVNRLLKEYKSYDSFRYIKYLKKDKKTSEIKLSEIAYASESCIFYLGYNSKSSKAHEFIDWFYYKALSEMRKDDTDIYIEKLKEEKRKLEEEHEKLMEKIAEINKVIL